MGWIGLAACAAGPSNRRHQSSKTALARKDLDSHFNLLAGLLPIPKDTAPHVRFAKCQFAEALGQSDNGDGYPSPRPIGQIGITRLVR
jgi:hypothetical protein